MRKISRDLLAQTLWRWHEKNPNRGENPDCGYCDDDDVNGDDDCLKCLCPKDICGDRHSLYNDCIDSLSAKEESVAADKIYSRLVAEWQRLEYGDLPEFGGAND